MSSTERNPTADGDDLADTRSLGSQTHLTPYPERPLLAMYAFPSEEKFQPPRSKRRQVKNACTNCQKACKKCDDARPCLRCVKYGIGEECIDSTRKERKKGVKRGPYKKRDGKGSNVDQVDAAEQPGMSTIQCMPQASASSMPPHLPAFPLGYYKPSDPPYFPILVGFSPGFSPNMISRLPSNIPPLQNMDDPAAYVPPGFWPYPYVYTGQVPAGGSVDLGSVHGRDDQGQGERN